MHICLDYVFFLVGTTEPNHDIPKEWFTIIQTAMKVAFSRLGQLWSVATPWFVAIVHFQTIKQMLLTLGKIFIDFSMRACNLWTTVATRVVTFGPLWGCLRLSTPEWFSLFRNLIDINYLLKKKQKKFILIK